MIVCLEGIDACGKATQAALLAKRLGDGTRVFSFPDYNTVTGLLIGSHLRRQWHAAWDDRNEHGPTTELVLNPLVFQSLMAVNRMEQAPALQRIRRHNMHAVLDRYWPSGVVYGQAEGLGYEYLVHIHRCLPQAEHYFLLDIDPSESQRRRPERADRYEEDGDMMRTVRAGYLSMWHHMADSRIVPGHWHVIDGNRPTEEVTEEIWQRLKILRAT